MMKDQDIVSWGSMTRTRVHLLGNACTSTTDAEIADTTGAERDIDIVLVSDVPENYSVALVKAFQLATRLFRVIYIYSDGLFLRAHSVFQGEYLAKCWPGGRVVSWFELRHEGRG
jgi:hypothetical protein